jgi:hypothetical protein
MENIPAPAAQTQPPEPIPQPLDPAAPPATKIVVEGQLTERELDLQRRLDAAETARKKAETDAAYAQDEAARLRTPPQREKKASWGFFEEND